MKPKLNIFVFKIFWDGLIALGPEPVHEVRGVIELSQYRAKFELDSIKKLELD